MAQRAREYKTAGIILDRTDVFDADRSFLIFTRLLGKVRARARGVRKPGSKLGGHLLPLLPVQLELAETGDFYLITQATLLDTGANYTGSTLNWLEQGAVLAEAVNLLVQEKEAHPEIFDGMLYTVDRLAILIEADRPRMAQLMVAEFLMKMVKVLGYDPVLDRCVASGEPLSRDGLRWSSELGGVLLRGQERAAQQQVIPIDDARTVVVLRQLVQPQFRVEQLNIPVEVATEVLALVLDYLQYIAGKPFTTARFFGMQRAPLI